MSIKILDIVAKVQPQKNMKTWMNEASDTESILNSLGFVPQSFESLNFWAFYFVIYLQTMRD